MSLTLYNSGLNVPVLKVTFMGTAEANINDTSRFVEWLKTCPFADHLVVQFGTMSPVTVNRILHGELDRFVSSAETESAISRANDCAASDFSPL